MADHGGAGARWRPAGHRPKALAEVAAHLGCAVPGGARAGGVAAGAGGVAAGAGGVVAGTCQDSRDVRPGDLYAALPGARWHGADFAAEAAARGAVAAVSDRPVPGLATLVVPDPRAAVGPLAAWVLDDPSRALDLYGVTGTNGKTSTTHLIEAGLAAAGRRSGLVSGVVARGPLGERPSRRTTPEASELQEVLAVLRDQGVTAAAVEVSSHGLALRRVDGTAFRAAVFTNLGPDHLDLHGDLEGLYAAKARLFDPERCGLAVVGVDDAWGVRLAATARVPVVTFSATGAPADWTATRVRATARSTSFRLRGPGVDTPVRLRLLGAHQVDNALAALAVLAATGVDVGAALAGVTALPGVPGRLERVDAGQPFLALVDHVHNTSGQERLFPYLRSLTSGAVHVVIGATGERDPGKRRPLGRTAAMGADTVVVTDESPHSEDPAVLREAVAAGARSAGRARVLVEPDRAAAIRAAVGAAAAGDVVVVTGRGCDTELVAGGCTRVFDDREVLRAALAEAVRDRAA